MGELFDRVAQVTFAAEGAESIIVRGLRVRFYATLTLDAQPHELALEVYNAAEATRRALQRPRSTVGVDAGYGDDIGRVFAGDILWSATIPDPPLTRTEVQAADGSRGRRSRVKRTLRRGATAADALRALVEPTGLLVPPEVLARPELARQYLTGLTISGRAGDQIDRLMKRLGLEWHIVEGKIRVLAPDEVAPGEALVVSQDTGMIGSPSIGAPVNAGDKPVVTARMLLERRARPGGQILISSKSVNGLFKLTRVEHEGDTGGSVWETRLEAVRP